MHKSLVKTVIAVVVIGGALGYLALNAVKSSYAYYISVDDFTEKREEAKTAVFRVAGTVEKGSVARELEKTQLRFNLAGKEASVPVSYHGVMPDNFTEDREVVVEGRLDNEGVFQAQKLMTKCESKYKANLE